MRCGVLFPAAFNLEEFSECDAEFDVFLRRGCNLGIGFEQVVEGNDGLDNGFRLETAVAEEAPDD